MSVSESTQSEMRPLYQVKWFSKKKGFGFVKNSGGEDIFVHHSDITVDGFRYLKEGEVITGTEEFMDDGKKKLERFLLQWREDDLCAKLRLLVAPEAVVVVNHLVQRKRLLHQPSQ